MPLRDGSNIPRTIPTTSFFDVYGPTQSDGTTRGIDQTSQPEIVLEAQAGGSTWWGDALNGIRGRATSAFNSLLDVHAANEINRHIDPIENVRTTRGEITDQPGGSGVALPQPTIFEDQRVMIAGGVAVALLVAVALVTR